MASLIFHYGSVHPLSPLRLAVFMNMHPCLSLHGMLSECLAKQPQCHCHSLRKTRRLLRAGGPMLATPTRPESNRRIDASGFGPVPVSPTQVMRSAIGRAEIPGGRVYWRPRCPSLPFLFWGGDSLKEKRRYLNPQKIP